jgi:hypothetical protein
VVVLSAVLKNTKSGRKGDGEKICGCLPEGKVPKFLTELKGRASEALARISGNFKRQDGRQRLFDEASTAASSVAAGGNGSINFAAQPDLKTQGAHPIVDQSTNLKINHCGSNFFSARALDYFGPYLNSSGHT